MKKALNPLEFLVVQEIFMSETAKFANVVLPGASFFEKSGTFTNGGCRVQRVNEVSVRALLRIAGGDDVFDAISQSLPFRTCASLGADVR